MPPAGTFFPGMGPSVRTGVSLPERIASNDGSTGWLELDITEFFPSVSLQMRSLPSSDSTAVINEGQLSIEKKPEFRILLQNRFTPSRIKII